MVRDPLKGVSSDFDKAVKDAKGDVQKLKDAIPKHPTKRIQANIPFEAWEEVYNAGMKAGMEGAKLSRGGKLPDYATGRFKQSDIHPKGGTTGEIMNAPKEKQLDFLDRLKVQNRDNTIAPSPTQLIPGVKTIDTRTDQRKIRDHDKMFGSNLAHNIPDHSKGHYDESGRPTSDPTKGINPGGGPVDLPHMEVPPEERQRRKGEHMRKYHT